MTFYTSLIEGRNLLTYTWFRCFLCRLSFLYFSNCLNYFLSYRFLWCCWFLWCNWFLWCSCFLSRCCLLFSSRFVIIDSYISILLLICIRVFAFLRCVPCCVCFVNFFLYYIILLCSNGCSSCCSLFIKFYSTTLNKLHESIKTDILN